MQDDCEKKARWRRKTRIRDLFYEFVFTRFIFYFPSWCFVSKRIRLTADRVTV